MHLSHAFLSALSSAYHGMWVFENVLDRLAPDLDRADEISKSERVVETLECWWERLAQGQGIVRSDARPLLNDEGSKAWRLLQVAEARLRALIAELTESSELDALIQEPLMRHVRAAALCENAHAQRVGIESLVRFAEMQGRQQDAFRYRQRLLSARGRVQEAERLLARLHEAEPDPPATLVAELLDSSLLLPANVAQRVIDIEQVFALYTGVFDYEDAGIPEVQAGVWADAGFDPRSAGRWFAAGFTPRKATEWMQAGTEDPLVAAAFMWRGFTPDEARPWLRRFISGRRAAAWAAAGCDAEDSREWIALGIVSPGQLATLPRADRMM